MIRMIRPFAPVLLAASFFALQGCWVPQVVSGVRPQIFPSAAASQAPNTGLTLESKLVALSTRLIAVAKRTSGLLALSADLATHRQALENHLYYNVKASGSFSGWTFANNGYSYYDSQSGARYSLSLLDASNQPSGFDVLGIGSYSQAQNSAKAFPAGVYRYQLQLQQPDLLAGDSLGLTLTGTWPVQIPLRGSFMTTLSGSGEGKGHALFNNLNLRVDGKSSSDRSVIEGQLGFSAEIDGVVYNGFGTLDHLGLTGDKNSPVHIQHNGISVAQIVRVDKRWDVIINERVLASGD